MSPHYGPALRALRLWQSGAPLQRDDLTYYEWMFLRVLRQQIGV